MMWKIQSFKCHILNQNSLENTAKQLQSNRIIEDRFTGDLDSEHTKY